MALAIPCITCGRTERPIMAWKGEEVCTEACRKARDGDGPAPKREPVGTWLVDIITQRPTDHTPCWGGVNEITTLGDEVEWFECPKCKATKTGQRIGHEIGEH